MKIFRKLISVLLITAIAILPVAALAVEPDPVVGYWYVFIDLKEYPEMASTAGNYDNMLSMYYFNESGSIYLLENDMKDYAATPMFTGNGRWEKTSSGYNVSIIGFGETTMIVSEDTAYLKIPNTQLSMKFRKITSFNFYTDYK